MKKTTILWLVGISAFALQCLLVGLSFASVCPMSAAVNFACGLLPLVFVPVLCPLIYRHGVKVWNRRRIYPPWNLISWGVVIAGQVCLACINFFVLIWGIVWFLSVFFPSAEISSLMNLLYIVADMFYRGLIFWTFGKLFLFILPCGPGSSAGLSASSSAKNTQPKQRRSLQTACFYCPIGIMR